MIIMQKTEVPRRKRVNAQRWNYDHGKEYLFVAYPVHVVLKNGSAKIQLMDNKTQTHCGRLLTRHGSYGIDRGMLYCGLLVACVIFTGTAEVHVKETGRLSLQVRVQQKKVSLQKKL